MATDGDKFWGPTPTNIKASRAVYRAIIDTEPVFIFIVPRTKKVLAGVAPDPQGRYTLHVCGVNPADQNSRAWLAGLLHAVGDKVEGGVN